MFSFKYWRQDLQASVVVFLVALPLCLGIALASNAPLASGLIAGIIGGLIIAPLSGSAVSVSGPAAGLTVIVINAIRDMGSFEAFTLAVFVGGIIQIIFGLLRGGVIGNYFPTSVIKGMLAAIGLILILKQLPHAVGWDASYMGDMTYEQLDGQNTFSEIMVALERFHRGAIVVALFSLGIMIMWEKLAGRGIKIFKLIPGALVAVVSSVILNELYKIGLPGFVIESSHLVQLPFSSFEGVVQGLKIPDFAGLTNPQVYISAATIALVGSLESLLSVDAADKLDPEGRISNKNKELFAQGAGNALSGFVGGLPITAVIVRTTANVTAGGRTNLSAFLHGVWLFACVITIAEILNMIPLASLAAVLLMVGYKLTKPELYMKTLKRGMNQFIPFVATIVAILFTDLLIGIIFGMIVGFAFVIRANMRKAVVMVQDENNYLIRFHKDMSFLQKTALMKNLDQVPENSSVMIDSSDVWVDDDICEVLDDYQRKAKAMNVNVTIKISRSALCPMFREV